MAKGKKETPPDGVPRLPKAPPVAGGEVAPSADRKRDQVANECARARAMLNRGADRAALSHVVRALELLSG